MIFSVAETIFVVPTIGAMAVNTPRMRSGVDADLGRGLQVHPVGEHRGVDCDERGDADEHHLRIVEAHGQDGLAGHAAQQLEDRGLGGRSAIEIPFTVGRFRRRR